MSAYTQNLLNDLLTTPDEVKAFDEQMAREPLFVVKNSSVDYYAATKDYFYRRSNDMGNETYTFIDLHKITSLHYSSTKKTGMSRQYFIDIRDKSGKILMNGLVESKSVLESLEAELGKLLSGVSSVED